MRRPLSWIFFLLLVPVLLAACTPDSEILPINDSQIIESGSSFGQSFTAQNNGLSGVSVFLSPLQSPDSGELIFHLRTNPNSKEDLATAFLPLSEVINQKYYTFDFPPQSDSQGKDYFFEINVDGGGGVEIFTAEADSYLDGAFYLNQNAQETQLNFSLKYERIVYLLGLSRLVLQWIFILIVGIFAFLIPGWAFLSLFWRNWDPLIWPLKLGLSCGLSLAIYPIFLLWTDLVGLHLGPYYAWIPPIIGLFILGWKNRGVFIHFRLHLRNLIHFNKEQVKLRTNVFTADIAYLVLIGLIVLSRMWVIQSLDVPLFGDSYQHTMMSQLIIENGGLFDSWEPYAELTTFTYHYGFHSLVAVFHWISGVPVEKAILWTGQLTNIFAIIALYPLAYKIGKNRWAGVIAVLIAGLLSPMPMSYVNWGRYTQLAGQVILPAVIWIAWSLLERPFLEWGNIPWIRRLVDWRNLSFDIGSLVVVWFVLGGIALTHYRILILAILFFPAYILLTVSRRTIIGLLGRIAWIGFGGFVLAAPWFIQAFGGKLIQIFTFQITTIPLKTAVNSEFFIVIRNFLPYMPIFIWVLFLICVAWGLWKRKKDIAVFTSWWFIIIIATNPNWIGLPGTDVITNFAIYISSYIPVSVIIGSVVGCILINDLPSKEAESQNLKIIFSKLPVTVLLFGIVCFFGIWGLINRIRDINIPNFELVTRPDLRAMEWIRDNTPIDARFLINSFSAYEDSSIVGSDAGWWLPLLAQRQSTVPPLTYVAEQGKTPDYAQKIKEFYEKVNEKGINDPEVLNMLKEEGINYVYVGQRHGSVNNPGPPLLDLEILNSDQHFQLIYHQDRVWVYKIN